MDRTRAPGTLRRRAGVYGLVAVLGVAVGAAVAGLPYHGATLAAVESVTSTSVAVAVTTTVAAAPTARPAAQVKVTVFNASATNGLAAKVGTKVADKGYALLAPGTTPDTLGNQATSTVYYRPGYELEPKAVAAVLGIDAASAKALPDPPPLPRGDADVVVVAGADVARQP